MKKIISLFKRDYEGTHLVYDEVVEGAEWVIAGEGMATRKWDGTCCKIENRKLYKRFDAKQGKTPPEGFIPAQEPDPVSGHWPGWVAVTISNEDRWLLEAAGGDPNDVDLPNGTYELVGPKINGNPESITAHTLIAHGRDSLNAPRTFSELKEWFKGKDIEGIVWHHPDGHMVKIKKKDFGLKRAQ